MDYLKERIKAAAYKLSGGIRFGIGLNLTYIDLLPEDLYSDWIRWCRPGDHEMNPRPWMHIADIILSQHYETKDLILFINGDYTKEYTSILATYSIH